MLPCLRQTNEPSTGGHRVSQLIALGRVILHRLAELDSAILQSKDPREVARLWRVRKRLLKIGQALIGKK
jgi:hypothetical protein